MSRELQPYTVVGFYVDSREQDTYVEWVNAYTVEHAVERAIDIDPDRVDAFPVAVFEGHIVDKLNDMGLASDPLPRGLASARATGCAYCGLEKPLERGLYCDANCAESARDAQEGALGE